MQQTSSPTYDQNHPAQNSKLCGNKFAKLVCILVFTMLLFTATIQPSVAALAPPLTLTVTTTDDGADNNQGDGTCLATSGGCTLRAAIQEINVYNLSTPGPHTINFDISGSGPHLIKVGSALPDINAPIQLFGDSQPGAACPTSASNPSVIKIVIDGSNAAGTVNGLTLGADSDGSVVKNIALINFNNHGLKIDSQNNTVQCNHIGLEANGDSVAGNGSSGIQISADDNLIGGAFASFRNVIAGNNDNGIALTSTANDNEIVGNIIGLDATAVRNRGNNNSGIEILGGDSNDVDANMIKFNGAAGIQVSNSAGSATGNRLTANTVYNNTGLGIDLEGDGSVEINDPNDLDSGANNLQNYPELLVAGNDLTVVGKLDSNANTQFRIEFFSSTSCDSTGYGEGETYLGSDIVMTNASGDANFTAQLNVDIAVGDSLTAVAINPLTGDTSEFSQCLQVTDAFIINSIDDIGDLDLGNGRCESSLPSLGANCSLRAAIEEVNALADASKTVYFAIEGDGPHTIATATALPNITQTIVLDGLTYQNGASCTAGLKLFVDGSAISGTTTDGINLSGQSANSSIQGVAIGNFPNAGIFVIVENANIWCNYVGLEANGKTAAPNKIGIEINRSAATIGATDKPNFISSNTEYGVRAILPNLTDLTIQRNTIGLDISQTLDKGNGLDGIYLRNVTDSIVSTNFVSGNDNHGISIWNSDEIQVNSNAVGVDGAVESAIGNSAKGIHFWDVSNSQIFGGWVAGNNSEGIAINISDHIEITSVTVGLDIEFEDAIPNLQGIHVDFSDHVVIGGTFRNWISGNSFAGIQVDNSSFVDILRNNIGVGVFGSDVGNGTHGINIVNSSDMEIGGSGFGNVIKYNGSGSAGAGIQILGSNSLRNHIFRNDISANASLGIDLNGDGVDINDTGDVDGNANGTQNFPTLTTVQTTASDMYVVGSFLTAPGQAYTLDFYQSATCDASGNGEGESYVGSLDVTAVANGSTFNFAGIIDPVPNGQYLTAIATDNNGNSSEFSNCKQVTTCTTVPPGVDPMIAIASGSVQLSWTPPATGNYFRIFRAINNPYFSSVGEYGSTSTNSWLDNDTNEVGNIAENHYYKVSTGVGTAGCFSEMSKTVGEFDFAIVPGN